MARDLIRHPLPRTARSRFKDTRPMTDAVDADARRDADQPPPREPKPHDAEINRLMAGDLAFYLPNDRRANTGQR